MEHLLSPREQVCWPAGQEEWTEFKQAGLLGKGRATQCAPGEHPESSVPQRATPGRHRERRMGNMCPGCQDKALLLNLKAASSRGPNMTKGTTQQTSVGAL